MDVPSPLFPDELRTLLTLRSGCLLQLPFGSTAFSGDPLAALPMGQQAIKCQSLAPLTI